MLPTAGAVISGVRLVGFGGPVCPYGSFPVRKPEGSLTDHPGSHKYFHGSAEFCPCSVGEPGELTAKRLCAPNYQGSLPPVWKVRWKSTRQNVTLLARTGGGEGLSLPHTNPPTFQGDTAASKKLELPGVITSWDDDESSILRTQKSPRFPSYFTSCPCVT